MTNPSGLFVTNEHAIRTNEKDAIQLVVDANLKTQRILTASVVRADKELDLALLRVQAKEVFATLPNLADLPSIYCGR